MFQAGGYADPGASLPDESDSGVGPCRRLKKFLQSSKYKLDAVIVRVASALQFVQLLSKACIVRGDLAQLHERTHDGNVDLNGPRTSQHPKRALRHLLA